MSKQSGAARSLETMGWALDSAGKWYDTKVRPHTEGAFVRVGETVRCYHRACKSTIHCADECYMYSDGTIECMRCHPKARPVVVDVLERECIICGTLIQTPDPGELTCSAKCLRALKRRNSRSAEKAQAEPKRGF